MFRVFRPQGFRFWQPISSRVMPCGKEFFLKCLLYMGVLSLSEVRASFQSGFHSVRRIQGSGLRDWGLGDSAFGCVGLERTIHVRVAEAMHDSHWAHDALRMHVEAAQSCRPIKPALDMSTT